jgi:hypothetical protein
MIENLLETIIEPFINWVLVSEKVELKKTDIELDLKYSDKQCLARVWDYKKCNPNLRCHFDSVFDGLCKQHYLMRPLKHKLITEDPPELEMLVQYRKVNPNVDNEIKILNHKEIRLFEPKIKTKVKLKKIVKDNSINNIEMAVASNNFKFLTSSKNLVLSVLEKKYPLDIDKILEGLIKDYKLESINQSKKDHLKELINENLIEIEIELNNLKREEEKKLEIQKKKEQQKKPIIKVKLNKTNVKIEDNKSYITSSTKNTYTNSVEEEDSDSDFDEEQSLTIKELMGEYSNFVKKINIQVPVGYCGKEDVKSLRIIDLDTLNDLICYEFEVVETVYLLNRQGMILGEKRKWVDSDLPEEYKKEDQVLNPNTCLPLYEYEIYNCSIMFHNITPKIYREYKWNDLFNELQETNEINILFEEKNLD